MNINEQANFIWSIADLLRGDFKQSEYGKVILPFTVLRRFDCVLAPSKAKILEANKTLTVSNKRPIFKRMTGHDYYNISQFDFEKLMDDSNAIEANLRDYINGFSEDVREIMDNFEIFGVIDKLSRANLLYLVVQRFAEIDMSDTQIDNLEMGYMFEELIRRFSEQSNETAGEHFTPREVIELMVEVLLDPDMDEIATIDGKVITILDPACGTGGMLSVAQNKMQALNATTRVIPFGQELNPETYATCCSDMILKGNTNSRIVLGNSFNEDRSFSTKKDKVYFTFKCPTYAEHGSRGCSDIKMRKSDLDLAVLSFIKSQMDVFIDMENTLRRLLAMKKAKLKQNNTQQEIKALRQKLASKQSLLSGLYVDLKEGMLSQDEYGHHREIITADIKALETNLAELENAKNETEEQITGEMKWKFMIQRFYDATEMTAEMADAFIESMKLHEDGSLEIKLSYMDEFAALMNTCERLRKEVA